METMNEMNNIRCLCEFAASRVPTLALSTHDIFKRGLTETPGVNSITMATPILPASNSSTDMFVANLLLNECSSYDCNRLTHC